MRGGGSDGLERLAAECGSLLLLLLGGRDSGRGRRGRTVLVVAGIAGAILIGEVWYGRSRVVVGRWLKQAKLCSII